MPTLDYTPGQTIFGRILRDSTVYNVTANDGTFSAIATAEGSDAFVQAHAVTLSEAGSNGVYAFTLPSGYTRQFEDRMVFYGYDGVTITQSDLALPLGSVDLSPEPAGGSSSTAVAPISGTLAEIRLTSDQGDRFELELFQHEGLTLQITTLDAAGNGVDLDGDTLSFRAYLRDGDETSPVITKTVGSGITIADQTDETTRGRCDVELAPTDTANAQELEWVFRNQTLKAVPVSGSLSVKKAPPLTT